MIDVNDVLDYASDELDAGRHERVLASPIALHCVAVEVDTAEPVDLHGMRTKQELWDAILASSRMPLAGGPPVEIDGRRFIDGGLASPIPVAEAVAAGATHVLALQTRPYGEPRRSVSRIGDRFILRHLRGLNPALVTLYRERVRRVRAARRRHRRPVARPVRGPPYVLGLRPPAGTPCVGQLERRAELAARRRGRRGAAGRAGAAACAPGARRLSVTRSSGSRRSRC